MSYAGDSAAKKIVRYELYSTISGCLSDIHGGSYYRKAKSAAIVLCGNEGAEVGTLHAIGGWPGSNIHCVDLVPDGLTAVKQKYPFVNTYHGDIFEYVDNVSPVGLFHLDLCGSLPAEYIPKLQKIARRIVPGGFLALTISRGRETQDSFIRNIRPLDYRSKKEGITMEDQREIATLLGPRFSGSLFGVAYRARYTGHKMPMLTVLYQKQPSPAARNYREWTSHVRQCGVIKGSYPPRDFKKLKMSKVRELVCYFSRDGLNAQEWSEALNIPVGTIAAWRAHATRGTYSEKVIQ